MKPPEKDIVAARILIVDDQEANVRLLERLLDGIERIFGERLAPAEAVARILADVRRRGDAALIEWSARIEWASVVCACANAFSRYVGRPLSLVAQNRRGRFSRLSMMYL